MPLLTTDDILRLAPDVDGPRLLASRFSSALASLNRLLCDAVQPARQMTVAGIVAGDGITVHLYHWATIVDTVTDSKGRDLAFTFTPTVSEITPDGSDSTMYGSTLVLDSERDTGDTVQVAGTFGFDTLPMALKSTLVSFMLAQDAHISGDHDVTSKSIEDVSESRADHSTDSPLRLPVDTDYDVLRQWALCDDFARLGMLDYPKPHHELPYWLTDAETWGGIYGSR